MLSSMAGESSESREEERSSRLAREVLDSRRRRPWVSEDSPVPWVKWKPLDQDVVRAWRALCVLWSPVLAGIEECTSVNRGAVRIKSSRPLWFRVFFVVWSGNYHWLLR